MKRIALYAALCLHGAALAQWASEPKTVFGIALGQPPDLNLYPACISPAPSDIYGNSRTPCMEVRPYNLPMISYKNLDLPGGYSSATAGFEGEVISAVRYEFNSTDYQKIKSILVERFGPPHRVADGTATTRMNLTVSNETLTWAGQENSITLYERNETITKSLVSFTNNEAMRKATARRGSQNKSEASKF